MSEGLNKHSNQLGAYIIKLYGEIYWKIYRVSKHVLTTQIQIKIMFEHAALQRKFRNFRSVML